MHCYSYIFCDLVTVICRIGSLEKQSMPQRLDHLVICRIGSLETLDDSRIKFSLVICRIGSLEKCEQAGKSKDCVICRIGSLENMAQTVRIESNVICRIVKCHKAHYLLILLNYLLLCTHEIEGIMQHSQYMQIKYLALRFVVVLSVNSANRKAAIRIWYSGLWITKV